MFRSCALVAIVAVTLLSGIASGNSGDALRLYRDHEFTDAIRACDGEDSVSARLVQVLAQFERYNIYKNDIDKKQAKVTLKILEGELTTEHVDAIAPLIAVPGNPNGNKVALKLLRGMLEQSGSSAADFRLLVRFVDPAFGTKANQTALRVLEKRLRPIRDYVKGGGTLPSEMRDAVFSNPDIIGPLAAALVRPNVASRARKCLVLIEEPALVHIRQLRRSKAVDDAIEDIQKAIEKRNKDYPGGSWSGPTG